MTPHFSTLIRNIPDFPLPGVQFKDITPMLQDAAALHQVIDELAERYVGKRIDIIAGVESRGFIFAAPLAYQLGAGMVPIRKPGKLPADTIEIQYRLEYGTSTLQIHRDAIRPGARVLLIDDLLATGGTIAAASRLIKTLGGEIVELAFVIELEFLHGRAALAGYPVYSMVQY